MLTMHLDEERVQRFLHGELVPADLIPVRDHVAACAACSDLVATARREEERVLALLRRVDHPPARVDVTTVVARATAGRFSWVRRAAVVLVALGMAGVAYAVPGSPLPAWLNAVAGRMKGRAARPVPLPVPAPAAGALAAGIAVPPGRALLIVFTWPQAAGLVQVSLTSGAEVVVRAPGGAATFTSGVDRLVIDNRDSSARFEIEVPRAAPRVEIRVAGQRIFLKEGSRVTTH